MPHIEIEIQYSPIVEREHQREQARTPQQPPRMVQTFGGRPGTCVFYDVPQRVVDVLAKRRIPFESLKPATLNHDREAAFSHDRKAALRASTDDRDTALKVLSLCFQPGDNAVFRAG